MGNCMAVNDNIPVQEEEEASTPSPVTEEIRGTTSLGDLDGKENGGVVRFRIVVTQRELKQILNYKKHSNSSSKPNLSFSVDHFLKAMKESGRMIPEVRTAGTGQDTVVHGGWKPALESIPEEYH